MYMTKRMDGFLRLNKLLSHNLIQRKWIPFLPLHLPNLIRLTHNQVSVLLPLCLESLQHQRLFEENTISIKSRSIFVSTGVENPALHSLKRRLPRRFFTSMVKKMPIQSRYLLF